MKKQIKKGQGFTLTELIIVIVIIAILAAVLIPTYTGMVNKAKDSNDTSLVKMLNDALTENEYLEQKSYDTLDDVVKILDDYGFKLSNLQAKSSKNTLVWNQVTDRFYILDDEGNIDTRDANPDPSEYIYATESNNNAKLTDSDNRYTFWLIYNKDTDLVYIENNTIVSNYSIYLAKTVTGTLTTSKGIDAGENTEIEKIIYANQGSAQNAIIRTATPNTNLVINAPKDTVKHYYLVGAINIIAVADSSYHEYGTSAFMQVSSGRIVLEESSSVSQIHICRESETIVDNEVTAKKDSTFANIIIDISKVDELPIFSRDQVTSISTDGTLVATVETASDNEKVYLFQNGIYEQIKVEKIDTTTQTPVWVDTSNADEDVKTVAKEIANNYDGKTAGNYTLTSSEINSETRELTATAQGKVTDSGLTETEIKKKISSNISNVKKDEISTCNHAWGEDNVCTICGLTKLYWTDKSILTGKDTDADSGIVINTEAKTVSISSAKGLAWLAKIVNDTDKYASTQCSGYEVSFAGYTLNLENDIDLSGYYWEPIGYDASYAFSGYFNGNGHKISYLYAVGNSNFDSNTSYVGLFGFVSCGVYENLTLNKISITGDQLVGGLIGFIQNGDDDWTTNYQKDYQINKIILLDSYINGAKYVGGIVGNGYFTLNECTVENSTIKGTDSTAYQIGGLVGFLRDGTINGSTVKETNIYGNKETGGIVGRTALYEGNESVTNNIVDNVKLYNMSNVEQTNLNAVAYGESNSFASIACYVADDKYNEKVENGNDFSIKLDYNSATEEYNKGSIQTLTISGNTIK